jgi:acyl dehydratase
VPLGGGNLKDAIAPNDIRRWVQAMQNPNPLYYDEEFAAASRFGRLVAPQSFAVCTSDSHGAAPAIQGRIEGTHMLFGGDEWWFFGPRIAPGDRIRQERLLVDYKVRDTKFAGPAVFARGDTIYSNQRGEKVAQQRSTAIRYRAEEARRRAPAVAEPEPAWSDADLARLESQKREYHQTVRALEHEPRRGVAVGDRLPTRVLGPHSLQSFTTEWRAYLMTVWGAFAPDGLPTSLRQAGWLPEMDKDMAAAAIDPAQADGLYKGSSRGHTQARYAQLIGLPRGYGYGASMGAWILDYLGNWAGEWGEITHSEMRYRAPVFTGDVSYLDGHVEAVGPADAVTVAVEITNQKREPVAGGRAELELRAP